MAATGIIPNYPAALFYEVAFNAAANQTALPLYFSDLSARTKTGPQSIQRGRQYELDTNQAGTWRTTLANTDGALDATNTASPYAPGVVPYRACRIRALTGANTLTGDQATAGEATGYQGPVPVGMNVSNDTGAAVSIVASATAYQGGQVYQVTLPTGSVTGTTVLLVSGVPVVPGTTYNFSGQVRIPSGTSTATNVQIVWYSLAGAALSSVAGASVVPTSGSTTWNGPTISGTAPTGAYSAALRIQIASGSTTTSTTWQCDGLQLEQSPIATPFQIPQTLSPNLLPRNIATGLGSMAATDSASNYFQTSGPVSSTLALAVGLSSAPSGQTTAAAWTVPASGAGDQAQLNDGVNTATPAGPAQDCVQVTAGQTYTASRYLMRASSADATVQVILQITWFTSAGVSLGVSFSSNITVPTSSWTRGTATGTAPAGATWGRCSIYLNGGVSATNTIYSTGLQFEQNSSASTWTDPGPTYYLYTGMVERWPQNWIFNGTYGLVQPIGVDALAALAQYTLQSPLAEDVLALSPNFFYQLNDPAGSTSCTDTAGKRIPAPVESSPAGLGGLTFGNSVTAFASSGLMQGSAGPVATFNNNPANSGQPVQEAETFVSIHKTTVAPGPPANGNWTRVIHFRAPTAPGGVNGAYAFWEALPQTALQPNNNSFFAMGTAGGGSSLLNLTVSGATGTAVQYAGTGPNVCDGNWHQVAMTCDNSGNVKIYVDGAAVTPNQNGGNTVITLPLVGITSDVLGTSVQLGAGYYRSGMVGDMACAAEFPSALTAAQITNLYNSFRSASSGESSGSRAARVLNWVGWTGATAIDTGQTTNMGPATDLTGATALDALNSIALTENGNFFASCGGTPTFTSRTRRYLQSPVYVFGENAALGEWPYQDVTADYDPQHLFNYVQVAQYSTGQVATAQDRTSQGAYFPHILQRTTNQGAFTETQDAAAYLLGRYKDARLRIANLTLNPSAVPGLFAVCLQLEIGTRIRVMRRTATAPAVQVDAFVESIAWTIDPDTGVVTVQLQCSPADLANYWVMGALHTTLHSQAASGQNQATINALPDSALNVLASSLPQGYQLTFDPGTAIAETMTLAPTGIPATSPGYSTATLTFTANFAFTHAANAVVCEPLPAGYGDPTLWDGQGVLGASSTTVLSGGASGTNTVTVGPLPDAAVNALGSDWNIGDLLWISPGTARFEGYNLLHPNVSTAGEGALPLAAGSSGSAYGIGAFYAAPAVTASATAWQGSNVWQTSVGASASTGHTLWFLPKAAITANLPYTWSAYARSATTGANPAVELLVNWFDANGNSLGSITSSQATLTGSPTAAWTRLTLSGTAPAGAVWAEIAIFLEGTTPSSAWAFQCDGLQFEQANAASTYCTTPQVKSVGASVPGYSSVQITLNTNLINSHNVGDTVCDPLPPGTTSPPASPARLAY